MKTWKEFLSEGDYHGDYDKDPAHIMSSMPPPANLDAGATHLFSPTKGSQETAVITKLSRRVEVLEREIVQLKQLLSKTTQTLVRH